MRMHLSKRQRGFSMLEVLLVVGIGAVVTSGAFMGFRIAYDDYQIQQQLQELSSLKSEASNLAVSQADWVGVTLPALQSGSERFPSRLRITAPNYETVFHTPLTTSIDTMVTVLSPTTPVLNWNLPQTSPTHCMKLVRALPPERYERVKIDGTIINIRDFAAVDAACTAVSKPTVSLGQAKTLMAPQESNGNMVGPLCLEGTVKDLTISSVCGACTNGTVTTITPKTTTCPSQWGAGVVTSGIATRSLDCQKSVNTTQSCHQVMGFTVISGTPIAATPSTPTRIKVGTCNTTTNSMWCTAAQLAAGIQWCASPVVTTWCAGALGYPSCGNPQLYWVVGDILSKGQPTLRCDGTTTYSCPAGYALSGTSCIPPPTITETYTDGCSTLQAKTL